MSAPGCRPIAPRWAASCSPVSPKPSSKQFLDRAAIRKRTEKTVIDRRELRGLIRQAAAQGFAVVDEELEIGLRSIAVPIRDRSGRIVAAINVSTQSGRFTVAAMRREILPLLQRAAGEIEAFFAVQ